MSSPRDLKKPVEEKKCIGGPLHTPADPRVTQEIFENPVIDPESISYLKAAADYYAECKRTGKTPLLQRFAIVGRIGKDKKYRLFYQPTLPHNPSEKQKELADKLYGLTNVVTADPELTGVVHFKGLEKRKKAAENAKERGENSDDFDLLEQNILLSGLSCYLTPELTMEIANRSTMNYDIGIVDPLAYQCFLFYSLGLLDESSYDKTLKRIKTDRQYTTASDLDRSLDFIFTKTLVESLGKYFSTHHPNIVKAVTLSDKECRFFEEIYHHWEKVRNNPHELSELLSETIFIAAALQELPQGKIPGRYWSNQTDAQIIEHTLIIAKKYKIPINLNKTPTRLKHIDQAILVFAANKNDSDMAKVLLIGGADLFKEENGHVSYAKDHAEYHAVYDYLAQCETWYDATKNKKLDIIKHLPPILIHRGLTPLLLAIKFDDLSTLKAILDLHNQDVNQCSSESTKTPLFIAAQKNNLPFVTELILHNASIYRVTSHPDFEREIPASLKHFFKQIPEKDRALIIKIVKSAKREDAEKVLEFLIQHNDIENFLSKHRFILASLRKNEPPAQVLLILKTLEAIDSDTMSTPITSSLFSPALAAEEVRKHVSKLVKDTFKNYKPENDEEEKIIHHLKNFLKKLPDITDNSRKQIDIMIGFLEAKKQGLTQGSIKSTLLPGIITDALSYLNIYHKLNYKQDNLENLKTVYEEYEKSQKKPNSPSTS